MKSNPPVRAIIVTNQHAAYAAPDTTDGKLKTIAEYSSTDVARQMDRDMFRSFLADAQTQSVYVVGKNTWSDMGNTLRQKILSKAHSVLVSSADEILAVDKKQTRQLVQFRDETLYVKTGTLSAFALNHSGINDGCEINVLGGLSVYRAFSGMYTDVFLCRVHTHELETQRIAQDFDKIFLARRPLKEGEFEAFLPRPEVEDCTVEEGGLGFGTLWSQDAFTISQREPFPMASMSHRSVTFNVSSVTETALYRVKRYKRKMSND